MNRKFWQRRVFTIEDPPYYQCPYCNQGIYKPNKKLCQEENTNVSYPNGPDTIYFLSLILKCTHCGKVVSFTADLTKKYEVEVKTPDGSIDYRDMTYIEPKSIYPPIPIIRCDSLPTSIRKQLLLSFYLFYIDLEACSTALRKAIELILFENLNTKDSLDLHKRINKVENKWLQTLLIGVKNMGNAGTHGNYSSEKITSDDILDGYEFIEKILDEYYYKSKDELHSKAIAMSERFDKK